MQFSRDVRHYRSTPRSLSSSKFGPYARLSVERRKSLASKAMDWAYVIGLGFWIGVMWYLTVGLRA
ncbi:hypothetical protein PBR31_00054 [Xanthomonas phage PBR31]|uniref:Uncharacterized protein n=1 Tax=Xanthomonas phage PPDBI TaxID=2723911 RepID=A0A6H0X618_9CAUD|nr:hypothetical protein PBR31_00054 [Xanthomonas phage PBR31]QIW89413.1 hypothetical protein PPDBI_00054 [Xanthomonas phage PPDBI]